MAEHRTAWFSEVLTKLAMLVSREAIKQKCCTKKQEISKMFTFKIRRMLVILANSEFYDLLRNSLSEFRLDRRSFATKEVGFF